jgi:NADPH-dependent curcumin reductase CurA
MFIIGRIKIVILQVKLLKEKLGFDDAFNYKTEPDLVEALKRFVSV